MRTLKHKLVSTPTGVSTYAHTHALACSVLCHFSDSFRIHPWCCRCFTFVSVSLSLSLSLSRCLSLSLYLSLPICAFARVHLCANGRARAGLSLHACVCGCTCTPLCAYMSDCVCPFASVHGCVYACFCGVAITCGTCAYACSQSRVCACVCACTCRLNKCVSVSTPCREAWDRQKRSS